MANKRSLNRVILVGTVGRDPEITHIPNLDRDVAKFSMVTNEVFMDRNTNQFQEQAEWHNIVAWGWHAKKVERSVKKGSLVLIEGKIKTRKWKDQNDQERRTTEIHADTVTPLDKFSREGGPDGGGAYQQGGYQQQGGGYPQQQQGGGYGQPPAGQPPAGSGGMSPGPAEQSYNPPPQQQAPPEAQYDDLNDFPYDDSDPF